MPRSKRSTNASRNARATRQASRAAWSRRRATTDELSRLNMRGEGRSLGGEQTLNQETRVAAHAHALGSRPLLEGDLVGIRQPVHPALLKELLIDRPEPALEGRVHGRAERDGLAVHGAARRDDEVGERDQALCVDGALGHDEAARARELLALRLRTWQHHGLLALEPLEHA